MAVGGFGGVDGPVSSFNGKITASVVITCIVAASSGLIFGYDIGISGGVTTMQPFLQKFFPSVLRKAAEAKTNIYCVYDSQVLTSFTSSLYIAGLAASLVASRLTAAIGRRNTMVLGGLTFLAGAAINGGAANVAMLIFGRILLGFGVGFTNQATPVYLSEVAPPRWRGAFNTGFQFFIGIGVVAANCINYGTAKRSWGWRLSLGLAVVPAAIMTIGALLISDTPSSLIERGKVEQARHSLRKVRGKDCDVEAELAELKKASDVANEAKREPFVTIFQRQYRPHLVMSIAIPFFQQLTGINIIAFYAPVLFQSVGFGNDSALIAAIILGLVNLASILVSTDVVDRFGRRFLFLEGGIQMFVCQVGVAVLLAVTTGVSGTKEISKGYAILVLVLMCIYAAGFGWSRPKILTLHSSVHTKKIPNQKMGKLWLICIASISILLPFLCNAFSPESPTDRRVLVLLDDFAIKSSHSLYFNALKSRGFDLEFKLADDPKIALQRYGQYLYDALILFCPSVERFGGSIDVAAIVNFVDSGHDLIVAADVNASDLIREVGTECGVDFDEDPSAMVIDHIGYAVSGTEGDHTLIASDDFIKSDVILGGKKIEAPILFRGIGHAVSPANSLVLKVLSASPSAYSANPKSKLSTPPPLTGSAISLVSIVQARNNARLLITGSLSMFSNRFFRSGVQKAGSQTKHEKSGNEQFLTEISKWIFHERGHLKAVNVKHHRVGETDEPALYRINDELEYAVEIYEWSGTSWEPYVANDVQLQFYMMSPYVLKTLSSDKKGLYSTSFKVPDVYGVFQFKVEHQKLGYTSLSLSKQIPVRPYRHNEYERFIPAAYPYYGAAFSMMAGFFIFSFAHLYSK